VLRGKFYSWRIVEESEVNGKAAYLLAVAKNSSPGKQGEQKSMPLKIFCRKSRA
jgi:hypothetical protein